MSLTFTSYVRSLQDDGEPPTPESFDGLLATLRGALVHEMKKRALWGASPRYLGGFGDDEWTDDDLQDLLLECYAFIFVRRLPGLQKQACVRPNVDGLVFLNIRNFLSDVQRRHDPLGYRVFEVLQAAVVSLLEDDMLSVLEGDARVRNETVLAFEPWHDPSQAEGVDLRRQVAAWNDALLPDLITAWNKDGVVAELASRIAGLPDDGVDVFRFRDLIEPLKDDARNRWRGVFSRVDAETAIDEDGPIAIVPLVRPDHGFEQRQHFAKVLDCVDEKLGRIEERKKTREYLRRLWAFLRHWAVESEGVPEAGADELGERLPPDKHLGEMLDVPRGRIPGLKATLGRLVEACREAAGAPSRSSDVAGRSPGGARGKGDVPMVLDRRREELRKATGQVAARAAARREALAEREAEPPRPGDTFVFAACRAFPVEWLVLEEDPDDPSRVWVAPVDDHPLVGRRDVAALSSADGDVVHVRCSYGAWLERAAFDLGLRVGALNAEVLELVRRKRAEITRDALRVEQPADRDPNYVDWTNQLREARSTLLSCSSNVVPIRRRRSRRAPPAWRSWRVESIAAVLGAVAIGLGVWAGHLRHQVETLSQPIVIRSSTTHDLRFLDAQRTPEPLPWTSTETHLGLYLDLSQIVRAYPIYRLELLKKEGEGAIWESTAIASDSELLLVIPWRSLTTGEYRLRIYGRGEEGGEVRLDERHVEIDVPE